MSWTAHIARDFFQVWHAKTENVVGKDPFLNTDPLLAPTCLNIHFNVTFDGRLNDMIQSPDFGGY
jgi:hypothetical protein